MPRWQILLSGRWHQNSCACVNIFATVGRVSSRMLSWPNTSSIDTASHFAKSLVTFKVKPSRRFRMPLAMMPWGKFKWRSDIVASNMIAPQWRARQAIRSVETIEKVRRIIMEDRYVTILEIAHEIGISTRLGHSTLTKHLRIVRALLIPLSNIQVFLFMKNIPIVWQVPYSPNLAPCDFCLFYNLKSWLKWKRFQSRKVNMRKATVELHRRCIIGDTSSDRITGRSVQGKHCKGD